MSVRSTKSADGSALASALSMGTRSLGKSQYLHDEMIMEYDADSLNLLEGSFALDFGFHQQEWSYLASPISDEALLDQANHRHGEVR